MSAISRRAFFEFSSGALGACVFSSPATAGYAPQVRPGAGRTKIYTVMMGIAPSRDDTDLEPMTNGEIVGRLRRDCPGADFEVRDLTAGARLETVLNEAKDLKKLGYDGVIIYSWPRDYDLFRTGLPTIKVSVLNDFMNDPFPLYRQNRVIGAMLDPWRFSADPVVADRMFQDLAGKVALIQMLKRMKSERILTVTDSRYVNVTYGDLLKNMPPDYNETILNAIDETFGTQVTKIGSPEVTGDPYVKSLWNADSREANELARQWIRNARKMINTTESEVVRSAKVCLAMRMLMEKHGATAMAFHIRTLIPNDRPEDRVFPALATSEFQLHNVVAKCQSHLNIILSEMMLQYACGVPSMLGDFAVDTYNNTSIVQHCEGPWNPWGGQRRVPYIITDHRERRVRARSRPGVGAASWILYPPDEPVTMWQIDVQSKEILLHTGKTLPMLTNAAKYRDHLYEMM